MSGLTDNLDAIADRIRLSFAAKDAAREKVLPRCREITFRASILSIMYYNSLPIRITIG